MDFHDFPMFRLVSAPTSMLHNRGASCKAWAMGAEAPLPPQTVRSMWRQIFGELESDHAIKIKVLPVQLNIYKNTKTKKRWNMHAYFASLRFVLK